MYLFCDNKYCKYHDPEVNRCRENNHDCPYQEELRAKENKSDVTENIIKPLFDAIDLEKSDCEPVEMPTIPKNKYVFGTGEFQPLKDAIIKQPKVIARVSIFGEGLVFNIMDTCKGFVKPTKKHIKNLKKYFGIDVKLFDNDDEVKE